MYMSSLGKLALKKTGKCEETFKTLNEEVTDYLFSSEHCSWYSYSAVLMEKKTYVLCTAQLIPKLPSWLCSYLTGIMWTCKDCTIPMQLQKILCQDCRVLKLHKLFLAQKHEIVVIRKVIGEKGTCRIEKSISKKSKNCKLCGIYLT